MEPGCINVCWQGEKRIQGNFHYMHIPTVSGQTLSYIQTWGGFIMKVMLNQILDGKGISQNQMAKDTGISVETIRDF